uniref:Uncharacterized protein n=1 Tax=viral metagenome TaxID=1070528 RepID=A0A6C0F3H8_9ZZZZ
MQFNNNLICIFLLKYLHKIVKLKPKRCKLLLELYAKFFKIFHISKI